MLIQRSSIKLLLLGAFLWSNLVLALPITSAVPEIEVSKFTSIDKAVLKAYSGSLGAIEGEIWWMAREYGVDYNLMYDLAFCESSLIHENQWGDYSTLTDSYLAYGLYQWHHNSWDDHNKWLEVELDRTKLIDQIEMTARVISEGGQHNWKNCWQKITKVAIQK